MSNIIGLLEKIGSDAILRHGSSNEVLVASHAAGVDPRVHTALLAGNRSLLEAMLGARTNMVCAVAPGKDDDEGEEQPDRDDDEVRNFVPSLLRVA